MVNFPISPSTKEILATKLVGEQKQGARLAPDGQEKTNNQE